MSKSSPPKGSQKDVGTFALLIGFMMKIFLLVLPLLFSVATPLKADECVIELSSLSDLEKVVDLPPHVRTYTEDLLNAQQQGLQVSIRQSGVAGESIGLVSDIQVRGRSVTFKIDGALYKPYYGITVKTLGPHIELRDRSSILAHFEKNHSQQETVEQLLNAQEQGLRVSISEGGVVGELVGRVTDVRIENGKLAFKIEGKDHKPFYGISVKALGAHVEIRGRAEITSYLSSHPREKDSIEKLLQAQDENLRVSIKEGGVTGETIGQVSDVRIENGGLAFRIDGEDYEPFYGISVKILGPHLEIRDSKAILDFLASNPADLKAAEQLLHAQEVKQIVSIKEGGVAGETTGQITDVRIENGKLLFKVDGEDYKPFYGISVRPH